MTDRKKGSRAYAVFIAVLVILLFLAVALFIYGSVTNGLPPPQLPGKGHLALGTTLRHG